MVILILLVILFLIFVFSFLVPSDYFQEQESSHVEYSPPSHSSETEKPPIGMTAGGGLGFRIGDSNLGIDMQSGEVHLMP